MSTIPKVWDVIGEVAAKYGDVQAKKKQDKLDQLALAIKIDEYIRKKKADQIQALRDEEDRKIKLENDKIAKENALRTNRLLAKGERYVNPIKNKEVKMPLRSVAPKEISEAIKNKTPVDLGTFKRDITVSPSKSDAEEGLGQVLAILGKPEMQTSLGRVKEAVLNKESAKEVAGITTSANTLITDKKIQGDKDVADLTTKSAEKIQDMKNDADREKLSQELKISDRQYKLDLQKLAQELSIANQVHDDAKAARINAEIIAKQKDRVEILKGIMTLVGGDKGVVKYVDPSKDKEQDVYTNMRKVIDNAKSKNENTVEFLYSDGTSKEMNITDAEEALAKIKSVLDNAQKTGGEKTVPKEVMDFLNKTSGDKTIKDYNSTPTKDKKPYVPLPEYKNVPGNLPLNDSSPFVGAGLGSPPPEQTIDNGNKNPPKKPAANKKSVPHKKETTIRLKKGQGLTDKQFQELLKKAQPPKD